MGWVASIRAALLAPNEFSARRFVVGNPGYRGAGADAGRVPCIRLLSDAFGRRHTRRSESFQADMAAGMGGCDGREHSYFSRYPQDGDSNQSADAPADQTAADARHQITRKLRRPCFGKYYLEARRTRVRRMRRRRDFA